MIPDQLIVFKLSPRILTLPFSVGPIQLYITWYCQCHIRRDSTIKISFGLKYSGIDEHNSMYLQKTLIYRLFLQSTPMYNLHHSPDPMTIYNSFLYRVRYLFHFLKAIISSLRFVRLLSPNWTELSLMPLYYIYSTEIIFKKGVSLTY